jgi:hypothetical protein
MLISLEDLFREHDDELSAKSCEQTLQRDFTSLGLGLYVDKCFNV